MADSSHRAPTAAVVLAVITLMAGLLALVPASVAATAHVPGFGNIIAAGVAAPTSSLTGSGAPATFVYVDSNSDGRLSANEAVYLSQGGQLAAGDIRIANPVAGSPGTIILPGAGDEGVAATVLSGTLRYLDGDGSGRVSQGDTVVYDLADNQATRLSVNDVILVGTAPGTLATTSTPSSGVPIQDLTFNVAYRDMDNDATLDAGEAVVLDLDQDGYLTVLDIRIVNVPAGRFGTFARIGDADLTHRLITDATAFTYLYWDQDGNQNPGRDEPVYAVPTNTGTNTISVFAVRWAAPPVSVSGSFVVEGMSDFGVPGRSLAASLRYVDGNANNALDTADTLYLDLDTTGVGTVGLGDVILSGSSAGQHVAPGWGQIGQGLAFPGGQLAYVDADGNRNFNRGDILFLDTNGNTFVDAGDVQLSLSPDQDTGDGTDGTDGTDGGDGTDGTDGDGDTGSGNDTTDGNDTADDEPSELELERQRADEAEARATAAQDRADEAEDRADAADERADEAEAEVQRLRERVDSLEANASELWDQWNASRSAEPANVEVPGPGPALVVLAGAVAVTLASGRRRRVR